MAFMPPTEEDKSKKDIVFEKLKNGIQDVLESENFKNWCITSSKMYSNNYSFKNAMLTYLQKPEASYVMGYDAWKSFGRQVKAGAKSIEIFVPMFAREYEKDGLFKIINKSLSEQLKTGVSLASYSLGQSNLSFTMQQNGILGLKVNGQEKLRFMSNDECKKFIERNIIGKVPMGYNVGHVFDVSDTTAPEHLWLKKGFKKSEQVFDNDGYPVRNKKGEYKIINTEERQSKFVASPDMTIPENDTEKMKILFSVLQKVSMDKGIPMTVERIEDEDTKGFFRRGDNSCIVISDRISSYSEMCAVAFHEMGHSNLHGDLGKLEAELGQEIDTSIREVQAEAVAYMTASKFGINTDTSSFTYIADWSKGKELNDLAKSLDIIYRAGKSMIQDIEKEIDARGLNLSLEPMPKEPLTIDENLALGKEYASFVVEKTSLYGDIIKDITTSLSPSVTTNPEEREIALKQSKIVKNIYSCINEMSALTQELQNSDHRETQDSLVNKLNALVSRVGQYEDNYDMLQDFMINILKQELDSRDLKRLYDKKPLETLQELRDKYPAMKKLTENDLTYISTSKFVSREYSHLLNSDPQQFVNNVLEQLKRVNKVQSKNGTFVEIAFCEQWGDTPIFSSGTVAHPKLVNSIVKQAESQIRAFKDIAEKQGEYYPYSKCNLTVYTLNKNGDMTGINTRIDIGDSEQTDLIDHMEQVCSGVKKAEILNNLIDSMKERTAKTKILTPDPTLKQQEQEAITSFVQSMSEWKNEIDDKRAEISERTSSQDENGKIEVTKHDAHSDQRGKP